MLNNTKDSDCIIIETHMLRLFASDIKPHGNRDYVASLLNAGFPYSE